MASKWFVLPVREMRCFNCLYPVLVYPDGKVCISILHPPGEDEFGYEKASERWSPIHTVETILYVVTNYLQKHSLLVHRTALASFPCCPIRMTSPLPILMLRYILSLFHSAIQISHPIQKQWREDRAGFKKKAQRCVRNSQVCKHCKVSFEHPILKSFFYHRKTCSSGKPPEGEVCFIDVEDDGRKQINTGRRSFMTFVCGINKLTICKPNRHYEYTSNWIRRDREQAPFGQRVLKHFPFTSQC